MKLDKWAVIAEIVGSFAVVVTLIVLIVQVRENTEVIQTTNRESATQRTEERTLAVALDPQFAQLLVLAREPGGIEEGSPEATQMVYYTAQMASLVVRSR